jgi:type II secretory pathway pseudopilin PulG
MFTMGIIGVLSLLAVPNIRQTAELTEAVAIANNVRVLTNTIELYGLSTGAYPSIWESDSLSPEAAQYLPSTWRESEYSWFIMTVAGITYTVVDGLDLTTRQSLRIDKVLDDGNPATGEVRIQGNDRLIYLIIPPAI